MSKLLGNETLGKNIKRIRQSCGLSQEQTVAKLQVLGSPLSRSTYSLIEMGRGNIFVNDLVGLQKVFNTSFDDQRPRAPMLWALLFFGGLCGKGGAGDFLAGPVEIRWLIW